MKKKYKIQSICTLTGELKIDKVNKGHIGNVGYVDFYEVNGEKSCMIFTKCEGGYGGFITTAVIDDKEEIDEYITTRIIKTHNSIYTLTEVKTGEEVCD